MGPGPIPLCISSNLLCFAALSASQLYQSVLNAHHIPSRSQNEICPFSLMLFYFCQYFHSEVQSKTLEQYILNSLQQLPVNGKTFTHLQRYRRYLRIWLQYYIFDILVCFYPFLSRCCTAKLFSSVDFTLHFAAGIIFIWEGWMKLITFKQMKAFGEFHID